MMTRAQTLTDWCLSLDLSWLGEWRAFLQTPEFWLWSKEIINKIPETGTLLVAIYLNMSCTYSIYTHTHREWEREHNLLDVLPLPDTSTLGLVRKLQSQSSLSDTDMSSSCTPQKSYCPVFNVHIGPVYEQQYIKTIAGGGIRRICF